jgi:oxygen-independent coproporphyrinogen-3 oxidase
MTVNPDPAGFGVYVHWPFCAAKCPYCDFNSHVRHGGIDEVRFRDALLTELRETRALIGPRKTGSIFFGGGTPSLMSADTVAATISAIDTAWPIEADAEITLEANPTSVEAGRFRGYRQAGVNRVSLGVQSLRDEELRALGRMHDVSQARAAIETARATFDRFSFDLIYARPRQTLAQWEQELAVALQLAGDHLSLYQLTIEPATPFAALHAAGKLAVPDPDHALALYALTEEMTKAAGLHLYEISNYARPGEESRHNLLYWRYGEYAGIGAGAHGRLIVDGARTATSTERNPEQWAARVARNGHGRTEASALSRAEQADECLLMGLRLAEGLDLARLAAIGGVRPSPAVLERLADLDMLSVSSDRRRIATTRGGRLVLDRIVAELSASFEAVGDENARSA